MADDPVLVARVKRLEGYTVEQLRKHWQGLCRDGEVMPTGKRALVAELVVLEQRAGTRSGSVKGRHHG